MLATFAATGAFLAAGDRLVAGQGLTSARWQVLGAVALADRPLTVAQIARRMGLARQSVHASVRRLVDDETLAFSANADHRRSPLVHLTAAGESVYAEVDALQARWADGLAEGIAPADLDAAARVLTQLCGRLDAAGPHEEEIP